MAIFEPKRCVNPFGKMSIFRLFSTCCFYSLERRFLSLDYNKRHFPCLYCLKKKVDKMAIFEPKRCVNPFGKMSIFRLFSTCCFYSLERRFLSLHYHKRYFPGLYCLKTKVEKMAIFGPKPSCCFYRLERRFFSLDCHKKHFPDLYYLKRKSSKNGHFWTKTMG